MPIDKTRSTSPDKVVSFCSNASAKGTVAKERTDNVIGQRLTMERKRRGLTLEALGELLQRCGMDIQIQGLNKWKKGITVPNAYQFVAVCCILGILGLRTVWLVWNRHF